MRTNKIQLLLGIYLHYLNSMKRNPARIIEILVWPSLEVVLFGFLASSGATESQQTATITARILAGIVYWNCTARIIQESTAQLTDDFLSKNIQNILITPISLGELLFGITAASITKILLSTGALLCVIAFVFPTFLSTVGAQAIIWMLQLELFGVALSFISISCIFLLGGRASFSGWAISTIIQIFSLVFYSRDALPGVFRTLSYAVPSSYIFELIRLYQPTSPIENTYQLISLSLSLIYIIVGTIMVNISYRLAKQLGTLIKL